MVEIFDMTNVEPDLSILDRNNDPEHLDISQLRLTKIFVLSIYIMNF